jgi:hypothetical protein
MVEMALPLVSLGLPCFMLAEVLVIGRVLEALVDQAVLDQETTAVVAMDMILAQVKMV